MGGWSRILDDIEGLRRRLDGISTAIEGIRLQIMQMRDQASSISDTSSPSEGGLHEPEEYPTAFGRNIDRLRLECHWTYDDLEYWSDISKSQIINHIRKGKTPYPRTLAKYCDVFSKKLGRRITSSDLLEEKIQEK